MNGRFEGIIQKVNKPKFINKHNVWSFSLKENGKWTSVWRKDRSKADELYRLLVKRMKSNGLGIDLKPTTLSQKQLEISQLCFNRLEANEFLKMDDDSTATKMLSAVDFFIQHYYEHEVPKVKDAVQMFLEKQEQRNLSEYTLRDYRNVLSLFVDEYAKARISMIKPMDCKKFVQEKVSPNNRKHRQIYLKAFFEFCCGKNNPYCEDEAWLRKNPVNWELPKIEANEITCLTYDDIIKLLRLSFQKGLLGFYVFRLFSMMRREEHLRFVEIGGNKVEQNNYINLDERRITINNQVYKKRSSYENRGRHYNEIEDAFMEWLHYLKDNNIPISATKRDEQLIRNLVKGKKRNILRHTAITYHTLKFRDPMRTAYVAGNSVEMIQRHYLNMNVPKDDIKRFFELTPTKAKEIGIID